MEIRITNIVEVPLKSLGKCSVCGNSLKKNIPRIGRSYTTRYGYANGFVCYKCYKNIMDEDVILLKNGLRLTKKFRKEMDKLVKKQHKFILLEGIENLNE